MFNPPYYFACVPRRPSLTPIAAVALLPMLCSRLWWAFPRVNELAAAIASATCSTNALDFGNFYVDDHFDSGGGCSFIMRCYHQQRWIGPRRTVRGSQHGRVHPAHIALLSPIAPDIDHEGRVRGERTVSVGISWRWRSHGQKDLHEVGARESLSSTAVTLFIDDCRPNGRRVHGPSSSNDIRRAHWVNRLSAWGSSEVPVVFFFGGPIHTHHHRAHENNNRTITEFRVDSGTILSEVETVLFLCVDTTHRQPMAIPIHRKYTVYDRYCTP